MFCMIFLTILTSCGGTSKDTVLRSTFLYESMQGITKKIPGPFAPPLKHNNQNFAHNLKLKSHINN